MNIFKNGVGRPSNETIKKRNIIKIGGFLLVALACVVLSYSLSKMGTKRLSGAVIKTEDKITLISSNPLNLDIDRYRFYTVLTINEQNFILIRDYDTDKFYLALYENGISDINDWLELITPNNDDVERWSMKVTSDGGVVYSSGNNINKMNLDGTYWTREISNYDPWIYVYEDTIYVKNYDPENECNFMRFDFDGNQMSNFVHRLENDVELDLRYFYVDGENAYLSYTYELYNSNFKILKYIKTDLNGNEIKSLDIDNAVLNINSNDYSNLDFLEMFEDGDFGKYKIFDDRIEYFLFIEARVKNNDSNDSYYSGSSNSYEQYLKKVIIDKNTFEIEDVIEYDDESLQFGEDDERRLVCLGIDINEKDDVFYNFSVSFNDDDSSSSYDSFSYDSSDGSNNRDFNLAKIRVDKRGNVINESSTSLSELIDNINYEFDGDYKFYNSNLLLPYLDSETEEIYIANIKFTSANGINIEETAGGTFSIDTNGETFEEGKNIEFSATASSGYEFTGIKIYDKDGNDITSSITVEDNSFKMPGYGIVIEPIFSKVNDSGSVNGSGNGGTIIGDGTNSGSQGSDANGNTSDGNQNNVSKTTYTTLNKFNPSTYDNIMKFIIIGGVSLIVVAGSVILVIKNKKK